MGWLVSDNLLVVAIHLVTESCDHYNLLRYLNEDDIVNDLIKQLEDCLNHELPYVSQYYFTTNISEKNRELEQGFQAYLDNLDDGDLF